MLTLTNLRCDLGAAPRGVMNDVPQLSWRIESDTPNCRQAAWQLRAMRLDARLGLDAEEDWVESPWQMDGESQLRDWPRLAGLELGHDGRYAWAVRIRTTDDAVSDWSETASFELFVPEAHEWTGRFIGRPAGEDGAVDHCPRLRRSFALDAEDSLVDATLRATALGVYYLELAGQPVTEDRLTPGWTEYESRLQLQTYDLTGALLDRLAAGETTVDLDVYLGPGWWAGELMRMHGGDPYGESVAFFAELELAYASGASASSPTRTGRRRRVPIASPSSTTARSTMPVWQPRADWGRSPWSTAICAPDHADGDPIREQEW